MILTPVCNSMTSSSYDVYCCKPVESIGTVRSAVQHSADTEERHSFGGGFNTNVSTHLDMTSSTTTFKENGARRPLGVATSNQLPVLSPRQLTDEAVDRLSTSSQQVNVAVNNKKRKSTAQHQTSTASRRNSQQLQFNVDLSPASAATSQTNSNCSPPGDHPQPQQQQQPYPGPPRVRRSANARERDRTHSVNSAFTTLRTLIPTEPADRKLSKIETIRLATSYIGHLQTVLMAGLDEAEQPCMLVRKRSLQAAVMSPADDVTGNSTHICTFCLSASKCKVQQNNAAMTSHVPGAHRATTTTNNNNNASCMFNYVGAFV